ncbi:2Fe-2S iron-sulfur cluster binding domain-containing protein [Pedobacter sp. HMF7056]|uniref:2Fe-2S iron-sulfur cluster binding domain-containing protein n=2 Tax=Hufsiella ginkgonis TaxID=2695274 RepID=A0A7K1XTJ8_9SPHI|nr:2Fe-2S iron-sulfur cluster binding domain-containing protein [Hufsiella ginkgonis]
MTKPVTLNVNGKKHTLETDPDAPLLYVLRNQLALNGPKYGCGLQQCGACMVLLDGKAEPSCMIPVTAVTNKLIVTLEGLAKADGTLHPVQQAFLDEQAAQCGYCLNGMVISAVALLKAAPNAGEQTIRQGMQRVLCRCGSQARVLRAVKRAVKNKPR